MLRPKKGQVLNEHSLCECSIIKSPHMDWYTGQTLTQLRSLSRLCLVREFVHLLASCTVQHPVCQPVKPISWIQNFSLRCYWMSPKGQSANQKFDFFHLDCGWQIGKVVGQNYGRI